MRAQESQCAVEGLARPASRASGFSLMELMVAMALVLTALAVVFGALHPAEGAFALEPEAADLMQRLRAAADSMGRDVRGAGAGPLAGPHAGPLIDAFAPVLPFRQGRRSPDLPGVFKRDTVTLIALTSSASQTTIAQPLPARAGSVSIHQNAGCPATDPSCGFRAGMQVAVFDGTGAFDMFSITAVSGTLLTLRHDMVDSSVIYPADVATIAEATLRTYFLKRDATTNTSQLVQYDGAGGADVPVVDHVVALSFELRGDPRPPRMRLPITDPVGPWTTYGPRPPLPTTQTTAYPPGENCAFVADGTLTPPSRLADLSAGASALVTLDAAELTDGPWCPDASSPSRYDADLLRVRALAVTVRVEAAADALRGPAGLLFARAGTSRSGTRMLPDQEIRFTIAPPNVDTHR